MAGCDGVIQLTANLKDSSECNTPCSGDNTLLCGGTKHISVYTDGTPSPKIPTLAFRPEPTEDAAFIPFWQYAGCYRYFCVLFFITTLVLTFTLLKR